MELAAANARIETLEAQAERLRAQLEALASAKADLEAETDALSVELSSQVRATIYR